MPDPIRRNLTLAQLNASAPLNLVPSDAKVVGVPGTGDPLGPDPLGASLEGAKHVYQTYAGLLTIGAVNEAKALRKVIPESWIRAFHGSPYDFDKFDLSKIGTGEGAQAYGHGLYFADREGVAKSYSDSLMKPLIGGKPAADVMAAEPQSIYDMLRVLRQTNPAANIEDAGRAWEAQSRRASIVGNVASYGGDARRFIKDPKTLELYDEMLKRGEIAYPKGKMYEVAIHASPEQLLDYDKPIRAQSAEMQSSVTRAMDALKAAGKEPAEYHELIGTPHGSEALRQAGIPGLQYLDQGSRVAGQGTKNYVIFDASIVDILKKYGLLLPAAKTLSQLHQSGEQ